jgi:pimeloyl-ACP methyl ester carboxylesterase
MTKVSDSLYVDDGGAGEPPVVFVHSAAGHSGQWSAQLAHVRRSRRALAVDLRGHGRSPAGVGADFQVAALAADLKATLDRLALGRVVLVGHSLGGSVCVSLAGSDPGRVAGVFLVDPSGDGRLVPKDQAAGMMAALRSDAYQPTIEGYWGSMVAASSPAVRARVLQDLRDTPPATVIGVLEALLTFDPVTPLRAYSGPRLSLITAANEGPGALHALVPELAHQKVDGTGHWVQLDAPDAVNRAFDAFARQHGL